MLRGAFRQLLVSVEIGVTDGSVTLARQAEVKFILGGEGGLKRFFRTWQI